MQPMLWSYLAGWSHAAASAALPRPYHQSSVDLGDVTPKSTPTLQSASHAFYADLERLARLVDVTYCVGTTGLESPFSCASRCKDFPTLELRSTWNTGVLLSDSCGYIAIDHEPNKLSQYSTTTKGEIIVAFRGTYSLTNTVVDLSTVPQEYIPYPEDGGGGDGDAQEDEPGYVEHKSNQRCSNCTVHMGFMESWRQARKLVLPVLKSLQGRYPDYIIHLVGHSLGGAVAALAALELKAGLHWKNIVVTTFGEPQVGNDGLVEYINRVFDLGRLDGYDPDLERRQFRRVTHTGDPVPALPLSEWGFRSHAGEVFLAKADLPPEREDLRLCRGNMDPKCIAGEQNGLFQLWQLLLAHRDYFWRLGLCVPSPFSVEAVGDNQWLRVDEL